MKRRKSCKRLSIFQLCGRTGLTFSQRLPNLVGISRQVEVGLPGLQVANRTASPRHTKPLNEQVCG